MTWSLCLRLLTPNVRVYSQCVPENLHQETWWVVCKRQSQNLGIWIPHLSAAVCVLEKDIYPLCFKRWALINFLSLFIAVLKHGLMFEGAASFLNLCFIGKKSSSGDFTLPMFFFLALLILIKRPEAVKMLFLKLIPFWAIMSFQAPWHLSPRSQCRDKKYVCS